VKRDKVEDFKRLGVKRVNKAITAIQSIGMLSNPKLYKYTEKQVDTIEDALQKAVAKQIKCFRARLEGKNPEFDLG